MKAGKGVILSFVERGFCFTLLSVPFSNELSGCEIMRMWLTKGDKRLWRLNMRTMLLFSCQKWMENTSINSYCPTTRWGTHRARACPCGDCCSVQMKNKTFSPPDSLHLIGPCTLPGKSLSMEHCKLNSNQWQDDSVSVEVEEVHREGKVNRGCCWELFQLEYSFITEAPDASSPEEHRGCREIRVDTVKVLGCIKTWSFDAH